MSKYPLLLFPTPSQGDRSTKRFAPRKIHFPTLDQQIERLGPVFKQLQDSFHASLQETTEGLDANTLVIEIIGSVDNFANAVKKIEGLEWLNELCIDDSDSDEYFYYKKKAGEKLPRSLYLVMSNQRGLQELKSLWDSYVKDSYEEFEQGLKPFKHLFKQIKTMRWWDVQDRLRETGLIEKWKEEKESDDNSVGRCEIELWYTTQESKRKNAAEKVCDRVKEAGGDVISQTIIPAIAYHAILAKLPRKAVESFIEAREDIQLITCNEVMFFRPVAQSMIVSDRVNESIAELESEGSYLPIGDPTIALLDGLPLENHFFLQQRLRVDDPDNVSEDYSVSACKHGTSMASLITRGDLNNKSAQPLARPLYVRPIMQPVSSNIDQFQEELPPDCLMTDVIHRAVKRLFEGDGTEGPVAPQIKVINLSIGDKNRPFIRNMSPAARLLDWLSFKYNVLFIVSAGNHSEPLKVNLSHDKFKLLSKSDRTTLMINKICADSIHRKLLSPAETINGLTVGALHINNCPEHKYPDYFIDLFSQTSRSSQLSMFEPNQFSIKPSIKSDAEFDGGKQFPSPISAFGSGYQRSIKPEVLFPGGKQIYQYDIHHSYKEQTVLSTLPNSYNQGLKVASPGQGSRGIIHTNGTSGATALASRAAGFCYDSLLRLISEQTSDHEKYEVPLLKAMLVHGCSWDSMRESFLSEDSKKLNAEKKNKRKQWMGYGVPRIERVLDCSEQRATLLGFGEFDSEGAQTFKLPLPEALGSEIVWRRLTVTLAWLSPICANNKNYRSAKLKFEILSNNDTDKKNAFFEKGFSDNNQLDSQRGTVEHRVFEGERAYPFSDENSIRIKVNCRIDDKDFSGAVPYGLVVSLEVGEGANINVYQQISEALETRVKV